MCTVSDNWRELLTGDLLKPEKNAVFRRIKPVHLTAFTGPRGLDRLAFFSGLHLTLDDLEAECTKPRDLRGFSFSSGGSRHADFFATNDLITVRLAKARDDLSRRGCVLGTAVEQIS